jgi:hypothetical protein
MAKSKAEQETIIRWDEETATLDVYTASALVARRLLAIGYPLEPLAGGWRGTAPLDALQFRPLVHGAPKKCRYCSENAPVLSGARTNSSQSAPGPTQECRSPREA